MQGNNFEKNMGEIVEQKLEGVDKNSDLSALRFDAEAALNDYESKTTAALERAFQAGTMDQNSYDAALAELTEAKSKAQKDLEARTMQYEQRRTANSRQYSLALSHAL